MGMNIYSLLDFLKKEKLEKENWKYEIKEIKKQISSFGILKTKNMEK